MRHNGNYTGLASDENIERIEAAIKLAEEVKAYELKEVEKLIMAEWAADSGEVVKGEFFGHVKGGSKEYALTYGDYTASGIFYDGELVDVCDVEGG